ncbi:MAG: amino acid adenylation domain-containing protein, partial [Candidatus Acidiferrales bacterium]
MNKDLQTNPRTPEQKMAPIANIFGEARDSKNPEGRIPRREFPALFPLSAGQRQMWFLDQLEAGNHYNEHFCLRIEGRVNLEVLKKAVQEILRRHETTRATFLLNEGQLIQRINPTYEVELPVIELRHLAESNRHAEAMRLAVDVARKPFDLAAGPTWRFSLVVHNEKESWLLITTHHIASDSWSCGVFLKEFGALYKAFREGKPSPLPEPPIQYADYASWQSEWLNSEGATRQLDYWKHQLSGVEPLFELPADRPRPPIRTFRGARHSFSLPKALSSQLIEFSERAGVTLNISLLAAFLALLNRYTGKNDIVVGVPIGNRAYPELEELIGYFDNTLALRNEVSSEMTFIELLQGVRRRTLGAFLNKDLPVEKLVEALRLERTQAYAPVYQHLFVFQKVPIPTIEIPGLSVSDFEIEKGIAKFDLTFSLFENDGGVAGWIEYATDLFDADRMARMAGHFEAMLEGVVANSNQRLNELPLLTSQEKRQLLIEWNDTKVDYPANICLHQLIEKQVERTPDGVAVQFEGKRLSYSELNGRSNQFAHYLQNMGVKPETLVGVYMERSLEMVIALCGVLKAGGAYVPIDPDYPEDRVAFMLQDADVPVLVTQDRLGNRFPDFKGKVVCIDRDWNQIKVESKANPQSRIAPQNLAYMIYTSGSTGRPKGAMNTHRGICNRLLWMQGQYGLTESDTVLQKTPFSFDVSVWEFFWPLLVGARLLVAEPGKHKDPAYLVKLIRDERVTVMHFVPPMLRVFLEVPGAENCKSLRHVICSGEALPFDLQEQFFGKLSAQLQNLYGPTEAAVDVAHWTCQRKSDRKIVPIGRPVANTQIYVLDKQLQPLPIGVPGELFLGGVQVGRGYHKRPELTAEKFIPDPFSQSPEARLYRTGDLCRWLSDGVVEYLGRLDFQVKIRGFRIELGEIETLLSDHPSVKACVVVAREYTPGDMRVVAYVVWQPGKEQSVEDLRNHLGKKLPDYMVPSAFVSLNDLPLSPNGKVDRKALPAPDLGGFAKGSTYERPDNETEKNLAALWADVLGLERVGVLDNFFELGGHSLLAAAIVTRVERVFGKRLPLASLIQAPTIRQFSELVASNHDKPSWSSLVKLAEGGPGRPLFLMHSHGGNILEYQPLANRLGKDRPIYALQARGLDGNIPENP